MDCSFPGSSVHGIFQARILEWVATSCSRGSSWPRKWTPISFISCTDRQILYHLAIKEAPSLNILRNRKEDGSLEQKKYTLEKIRNLHLRKWIRKFKLTLAQSFSGCDLSKEASFLTMNLSPRRFLAHWGYRKTNETHSSSIPPFLMSVVMGQRVSRLEVKDF